MAGIFGKVAARPPGGHCRAVMGAPDKRGVTHHSELGAHVAAWAESGAMAITGRAGADRVGPPAGLVPGLGSMGAELARSASRLGASIAVDALALLGERAAIAGLRPRGEVSCGGATRLLRARDDWFAVTLARAEDLELVPAWLEVDCPYDAAEAWSAIATATAPRPVADVVERAALLGLPAARLSEAAAASREPVELVAIGGPASPVGRLSDVIVVDLSALWAGPLCGALLAAGGATVIKVESLGRPDGARLGSPGFFDLMNAGKRSVALDLPSADGVGLLRRLLQRADVVIDSSRPRALEQMGIHASDLLAAGSPRVWASITGHGRAGAGRDRSAFGDDAAVAGGLVCWVEREPIFCADAVADPASGLFTAAAILRALATDRRWLLDVSMAAVAAHLAGPTLAVPHSFAGDIAPPRARPAAGRGPLLGEHTDDVMAELGL
ncbi:MAG: CoA transferase [Actinomycetota bacterium]